jgi:hypothetical protein
MLDGSSARAYEPRMRWLSILLVLAACSDKLPDPPSASAFAAMTEDQKCEATAPRATRCVEELMIADLRQLSTASGDGNLLADEVAKAWEDEPRAGGDEARRIHQAACLGDRDGGYMTAVVACWNEPDCKSFASCVYKPRGK